MDSLELQEKIVGIIVPIYNVQNYLKECLQSLIQQSYKNLYIILVNDGSGDENSLSIAKEYVLKDERIVLVDKKNGGQSSARNAGISLLNEEYEFEFEKEENGFYIFKIVNENPLNICRIYKNKNSFEDKQKPRFEVVAVEYLQFVDGDDFLELNCIEECVKRMNKVEVLWFDYKPLVEIAFKKSPKTQMQIFGYDKEQIITSKEWLENIKKSYKPLFWFAWQGMIDFNFLKQIELKFINGIIHEDHHFGILLFSMAENIYIYPKQKYIYRLRQGSSMNPNRKVERSSYLYPLFLKFNENIVMFAKYQEAINWFLVNLHTMEFIEKNACQKNLLEVKQIFLPDMLDRASSLLFIDENIIDLSSKLELLKPYFKEFKLSGAECIKNQLTYRLGHLFLMNYRSFKGLRYCFSQIKQIINDCKKEKKIFEKKLAKFPYIQFISDEQKEQNEYVKRVKNHYSFKLGRIIVNVLKYCGFIKDRDLV